MRVIDWERMCGEMGGIFGLSGLLWIEEIMKCVNITDMKRRTKFDYNRERDLGPRLFFFKGCVHLFTWRQKAKKGYRFKKG